MDEKKIIDDFIARGYDKAYAYEAEPGEIDEEHMHDFDTEIVVLKGQIQIQALDNGVMVNTSHQAGSHVRIEKDVPHSAKVGPNGCRYIVAEQHNISLWNRSFLKILKR